MAIGAPGPPGFNCFNALTTMDSQGAEVRRRWISAAYQRHNPRCTGLDEQRAEVLPSLQSLRLGDLTRCATLYDLIVKVEIEPHPAQP